MRKDILTLGGWFALTFSSAWVGSRFLPDTWYAQLKKPFWNPPNWVFAPVWTTLYTLMAIAAWLVGKQGGLKKNPLSLVLFVLQLALNAAWSWLFFGKHRPDVAVVELGALWTSIAATLVSFLRIKPLAGMLMLPYLAWVSFAGVLNLAIWRLNSGRAQSHGAAQTWTARLGVVE